MNAVSPRAARILEGHGKYDVEHVKRICEYAASRTGGGSRSGFRSGLHDSELEGIVRFAKRIGAKVGIQNYLYYRKGRNPADAKQMPWEGFYSMLKKLERELDFKLILDEADFGIERRSLFLSLSGRVRQWRLWSSAREVQGGGDSGLLRGGTLRSPTSAGARLRLRSGLRATSTTCFLGGWFEVAGNCRNCWR